MAEKRVLHIEVTSLEESLQQFASVWRQAERGEVVEAREAVGFESMAELLSTFTPKRWELIGQLRQAGSMSVYALAKLLERDYKNVHTDVKVLEKIGVIERDDQGHVQVPWDEIDAHILLAA
ncbi:MAG: hypothetical protein L0H73_17845 [Nitrococcus sp.]|nr:hypothetical protein [Nitrococcus sp.]